MAAGTAIDRAIVAALGALQSPVSAFNGNIPEDTDEDKPWCSFITELAPRKLGKDGVVRRYVGVTTFTVLADTAEILDTITGGIREAMASLTGAFRAYPDTEVGDNAGPLFRDVMTFTVTYLPSLPEDDEDETTD